jgi:hypothetical protein
MYISMPEILVGTLGRLALSPDWALLSLIVEMTMIKTNNHIMDCINLPFG